MWDLFCLPPLCGPKSILSFLGGHYSIFPKAEDGGRTAGEGQEGCSRQDPSQCLTLCSHGRLTAKYTKFEEGG